MQNTGVLKYSVVLIARDEEKHVEATIKSILNQSIKPYKIVVVNDSSVDSTPEILDRLPVVHQKMPELSCDPYERYEKIRTVGYACVKDDPVDWVYSGDAEIILPPRYCENIIKHSAENNAVIGAGIIEDLDDLPMSGCRMIRHDWLRSAGMTTKWESIHLCIMALAQGRSTLVRHATDCAVVSQRPLERNRLSREYGMGIVSSKMGGSFDMLMYAVARRVKARRFRHVREYMRGWLSGRTEVPDEMARTYRKLLRGYYMEKLGRHHAMLSKRGDNMICHV